MRRWLARFQLLKTRAGLASSGHSWLGRRPAQVVPTDGK
ncbi:hypothetical protein HBN54_000994 [Hymenobacter sp. 1B]|uniref:Uncharacterized protein n=1 Tax=Hymenobacter artigasi TaxID=2719616 RepID=A0ABX1HDZ7_9BACT|nr:hypothetical protein [Hymenobacter artigasi]